MPGLCKEPRSNCIREEFLGNLHLLSLEEREPLWIYFAGDSTGRQLWAAFLKDVANINLGNTKDAVRKLVDECPKAPVPDKAFQRFVNAHTRRAGLKYPKWEGVGVTLAIGMPPCMAKTDRCVSPLTFAASSTTPAMIYMCCKRWQMQEDGLQPGW